MDQDRHDLATRAARALVGDDSRPGFGDEESEDTAQLLVHWLMAKGRPEHDAYPVIRDRIIRRARERGVLPELEVTGT